MTCRDRSPGGALEPSSSFRDAARNRKTPIVMTRDAARPPSSCAYPAIFKIRELELDLATLRCMTDPATRCPDSRSSGSREPSFAIAIVHGEDQASARDWYGLSRREDQVLMSICAGMTDQEIANSLAISVATVRQYKKRLQDKVGAKRPSEILAAAVRGLPHLATSF